MNKVKRSLVLLLVGALLFSFITVLSSASVTIPQGPIDSTNRDNGINQIMEAGVEDINFATAIYDALVEEAISVMNLKMLEKYLLNLMEVSMHLIEALKAL